MSFHAVAGRLSASSFASYETVNLTKLPPNLLDSFIPGYSLISRFILESFGFDIGILVSIGLLSTVAITSSKYVGGKTWTIFRRYFTSSIHLEEGETMYFDFVKWMSEQKVSQDARNVKAVTPHIDMDSETETVSNADVEDHLNNSIYDSPQDVPLFNFSLWGIRTPLRLEPYLGRHYFRHRGNIFLLDRYRVSRGGKSEAAREEEVISIVCVGRSTRPIASLLEEVRVYALRRHERSTTIRRPCTKLERRWQFAPWQSAATRPSRPIQTVVLDLEQKIKILTDINEYLHPATRLWYASRGIPYRRGYLFHGPPGTGKTSLSFSLAGIFGLDVHVVSLQQPSLTEEDLVFLFNKLPSRCIVLLEDVDSAGVKREDEDEEQTKKPGRKKFQGKKDGADGTSKDANKDSDDKKTDGDWTILDVAKALQGANLRDRRERKKEGGISLSGLLNAIDGVASHEGRILVLTTNHPEKLDSALIRPGRVDMQIEFKLSSREQIKEMFTRMYVTDVQPTIYAPPSQAIKNPVASIFGKQNLSTHSANGVSNGSTLANGALKSSKTPVSGAPAVQPTVNAYPRFSRPTLSIREACCPPDPATTRSPLMPLADLLDLAEEFTTQVPDNTFSPAEIQGYLLTKKTSPADAVECVAEWVEAKMAARDDGAEKEKDGEEETTQEDKDVSSG